jgi:hypothetical protein
MENNDNFKLENEDREDQGNDKIYDDNYHDEIGQKLENLNILLEDREHNVNNEISKYYNDLFTKQTSNL